MTKPVFSVQVENRNQVHTRVKVFNRGGFSGTVVLNTSDADKFMERVGRAPDQDAALLAALKQAEQTLNNLALGWLTGDAKIIAINEADNLHTALALARGAK